MAYFRLAEDAVRERMPARGGAGKRAGFAAWCESSLWARDVSGAPLEMAFAAQVEGGAPLGNAVGGAGLVHKLSAPLAE